MLVEIVIMQHILYGQERANGVLNGLQNYGENHYDTYNSCCSVHAEVHACNKVAWRYRFNAKKNKKKVYNLLVIRTSKSGENLGMSRLCEKCVIYINKLSQNSGIKIRKIYYSTSDGDIHKTTLSKLTAEEDHHISTYYKKTGYKPSLPTKRNKNLKSCIH